MLRGRLRDRLSGERQAQLTAALLSGTEFTEADLIDVEAALDAWDEWLAADPYPAEDELVRKLMRELEVA